MLVRLAERALFEIEFWWELASLNTIMVLAQLPGNAGILPARGALSARAAQLPDATERMRVTESQTAPLSELHMGDIV